MALVLQTMTVWDYALHSRRTAGQIMSRGRSRRPGQRIGTLLVQIRSRFRANPLIHADNWLGVGTGNILWSNYEAQFYYFPVQFRDRIACPDTAETSSSWPLMTDPVAGEDACGNGSGSWPTLAIDRRDPGLATATRPSTRSRSGGSSRPARRGELRVFARKGPREQGRAAP